MANAPDRKSSSTGFYIVRHWDGFDNDWMDIGEAVSWEDALALWNKETKDGTKNTCYGDIDYYSIFPSDTRMALSSKAAPAPKEPKKKKQPPGMQPAILVDWTESEAGFGQRPDGVSLHANKEDAEQYIKDYWDGMPPRDANGQPPEVYVRPESARTHVLVDNKLYDEIAHSPKKGKRMGDRKLKEFRDKKRIVTKQDVAFAN